MNERHPGIPDLRGLAGPPPRMGVSLAAFVRTLDQEGTFEGQLHATPQGPRAGAPRESYCSVDELIELIRTAVREEVARVLIDTGIIGVGERDEA